jgi:hypothetical protein
VIFPPGALSAPTRVTIRVIDPPAFLTAAGGLGPAFQIDPDGLVLASAATVSVAVPGSVVAGVDLGRLLLVTSSHPLSLGPAAFQYLTAARSPEGSGVRLTAQTLHLGPLQPAVPPGT